MSENSCWAIGLTYRKISHVTNTQGLLIIFIYSFYRLLLLLESYFRAALWSATCMQKKQILLHCSFIPVCLSVNGKVLLFFFHGGTVPPGLIRVLLLAVRLQRGIHFLPQSLHLTGVWQAFGVLTWKKNISVNFFGEVDCQKNVKSNESILSF